MKFHTDHHFIIGHGHLADGKPCQDYTLSGLVGGGAYAVVSDGCSSAGQTDIGSRIIAITTGNAIIEAIEQTLVSRDDVHKRGELCWLDRTFPE